MAETTIQWADYTFNGWVGCQRVSPGCENCYAEAYDKRVGGVPKKQRTVDGPQLRWGPKAPRTRTSPSYWKQPLKWNAEARSVGERRKVFCSSLADVFEDRPELGAWRIELFTLIGQTPSLDWLLLTKRPENIERLMPKFSETWDSPLRPWPNVWLGTTVEDRGRLSRLDQLRAVPAVVRFCSFEPLIENLGAVDLRGIDWAIIGGESGGKARRFEAEWARSLVRQARAAGAAPFVKQMGANVIDRNDAGFNGDDDDGWHSAVDYGGHIRVEHDIDGYRDDYQGAPVRVHLRDHHGGDPLEWPRDLRVREFPEVRR